MPYSVEHNKGGGYSVKSPHGTKAKNTSKEKAEAQVRLLRGVKHGWKPTGKKSKKPSIHKAKVASGKKVFGFGK